MHPFSTVWRVRARLLRAFALLVLMLSVSTCTDGAAPFSPDGGGAGGRAPLALRPQFHVLGGSVNAAPINLVHLVARDSATSTLLADTLFAVNPDDSEWRPGLVLQLPPNLASVRVIVSIELIHEAGGQQSIEWSGVTRPIGVRAGAGATTEPVSLFQGPPSNLSVTAVTVTPGEATVVEGDSVAFNVAVTGATGAPRVFWSVTDPLIAVVNDRGVVRGLRDGRVQVIAVAGPRADTAAVTITQRAAAVEITPDSLVLTSLGAPGTFAARVLDPRGADVPGTTVTWEVRAVGVAASLGGGQVEARANGSTYVIATLAGSPAVRDSAVLRVAQRPVRARIEPASLTLTAIGEQQAVQFVAEDANGHAVAAAPQWSSDDTTVVRVSAAGVVRALRAGTATVRAVLVEGVAATVSVRVAPQPERIVVTPAELRFTSTGESGQLAGHAVDALGTVVPDVPLAWSSEQPAVAAVSPTGLVHAVGPGTTRVRAAGGGAEGFATVTVALVAAALEISPDIVTLGSIGEAAPLSVRALDRSGVAFVPSVTWASADAAIAAVSESGVVTAVANGTTWVHASVGGARDSARVVVRQRVAQLQVSTPMDTLVTGETVRLAVSARDALGSAIAAPVVAWSSLTATLVTVDGTGLVSALAAGQARVQAAADGATGSIALTVLPAGAVRIEASPAAIQLDALGDTARISAVAYDARGRLIAAPTLNWRSLQPLYARVADGLVTAAAAGSTQIVVSSGSGADTVAVTVTQVPVSVAIVSAAAMLHVGDTLRLGVSVLDARGNLVIDPGVQWDALDPGIATVDGMGLVHAQAPGQARIRVLLGALADTITIGVNALTSDLHLRSLQVVATASPAGDGDTAFVRVVVANTGQAAVTGAVVQLGLLDAASNTVLHGGRDTLDLLDPGDSVVLAQAFPIEAVGPLPDSVRVGARVDPDNAIVESVESNNGAFSASIRVRYLVRTLHIGPDSLGFATPDDTARVTPFVGDRFGRPLAGRALSWLSRNPAVATVDTFGTIRPVTTGDTWVTVSADGTTDSVRVIVRLAADLHWTNIILPGDYVTEGLPAPVSFRIRNSGAMTAPATQVRLRILDAGADTIVRDTLFPLPPLAPGDSIGFPGPLLIDSTIAWPDSVRFQLMVDPANLVPEQDEANNSFEGPTAVRVRFRVFRVASADSLVLDSPGDTARLPLTVEDRYGRVLADRTVHWLSLAPGVATVDSTGLVQRVAAGSTSVVVTVEGVADTVPVRSSPRANLGWSLLTGPGTPVHEGALFYTGLTVQNSGVVPSGATTLRIRLTDFVADTLIIERSVPIPPIDAGDSVMVADTFPLDTLRLWPDSLGYNLLIDPDNAVLESNELDNAYVRGAPFHFWYRVVRVVSVDSVALPGVGDTITLPVAYYDRLDRALSGRPVSWTSLNPGVAAVDTLGRLTITGAGATSVIVFVGGVADTVPVRGAVATGFTRVWMGANGTSWSDPGNWLPAGLPAVTDTVLIDGGVSPVLTTADTIAGLVVAAGRTVTLNQNLFVARRALIDGTVTGTGALVLTESAAFRAAAVGRVVARGTVMLAGPTVINGALDIEGGTFDVSSHTLTLHGNLLTSGGRLVMQHAAGHITVRDATFITNDTFGLLTDGRMVVRGNFASHNNYTTFTPSGNHTVAFEGDSAKSIYFAYGGVNSDRSHFQHLELNGAGAVTLNSTLAVAGDVTIAAGAGTINGQTQQARLMGDLIDPGDRWRFQTTVFTRDDHQVPFVLTTNLVLEAGWNLPGNVVINGNVTVSGDTLNLNGHSLTVHGTLTANGGRLGMRHPTDLLVVGRDAVFHTNGTHGLLTDGRMEVRGNFASHSNYTTFTPSDNHTVAFEGDTAKSIYIAYGGVNSDRSHFQHLELNGAGTVTLNSFLPVAGDVSIAAGAGTIDGQTQQARLLGDLSDPGDNWRFQTTVFTRDDHQVPFVLTTNLVLEAGWNLPADVVINGNVTMTGDTLNLNGHSLTVHGTLTANGGRLGMRDAADLLVIGRDAVFHTNDTFGLLTDGRMVVRGSFASHSNYTTFTPSGSHTVAFEGDTAKSIYIAYGGVNSDRSRFQHLELNGAGTVTLNSFLPVAGDVTIAAGAGTIAGQTQQARLMGDLVDPGDHWRFQTTTFTRDDHQVPFVLTTNVVLEGGWNLPGDVVINGNVTVTGDTLNLNGHSLTVHGTLTTNGGRLGMRDAADLLVVGRDAVFHTNDTFGLLTDGRLVVRGNFASHSNYTTFTPSGSHTVAFESDTAKTIYIAYGGDNTDRSRFQNLELNGLGQVTITTMLPVAGDLSIAATAGMVVGGGNVARLAGAFDDPGDRWRIGTTYLTRDDQIAVSAITTNLFLERGWNLTKDVVVNGNVTITGDTLNLNGNALTIHGSFTANGGRLGMRQAADSLVVRDATFHTNDTFGLLTAGRLVVRGNFASHSNYTTFTASDGHTVSLEGDTAKSIYIAYAGDNADRSRFQNLEFNGAGAVSLSSMLTAAGSVTILGTAGQVNGNGHVARLAGALADPGDHWRVGTTHFTTDAVVLSTALTTNVVLERGWNLVSDAVVNGHVTVAGDTLNLNGRTLTVHGNFTTNGGRLGMRQASDLLVVGRDATFHTNDTFGLLTAGRLVVRGNFASHSNYTTFSASDSHTVELAGDTAKSVYFGYAGPGDDRSNFHHLELSGAGTVSLGTIAYVRGTLTSGGGSLSGPNGITVAGTAVNGLTINNAPLTINGGAIAQFDGVTFTGFSQAATPLTVRQAGGTITMNNLSFQTVPTTGYYLSLINTSGNALTLNLPGAAPASPGDRLAVSGTPLPTINW